MNIFELLVVQPIFNLLLWLYSIVPYADFGIAVIIFTLIVRFAMWPLVVKQLHQVKAMRKLQPELAKIRKANKGNRQAESLQMLDLYKRHEVKPFRSILLLLIQLPIFIALFRVIQIFTSHREEIGEFTYGFMQNLPVVKDLLANPDGFNSMFLGFVDITQHAITTNGVNVFLFILAVAAAYTQYIISKQTSPSTSTKRLRDVLAEAGEGKEPDQAELNAVMTSKMIKFLPFMMFFIMLSLPGAIGLYYVVSNIFAAIQQHFILKKDVEQLGKMATNELRNQSRKATARAKARQERAEALAAKLKERSANRTSSKTGDKSKVAGDKEGATPAKKNTATNITRITAKDNGRKKEK